jgi:hypothetical protein
MQVGEVALATRRTECYNHTTTDQATSQDSVCSSRPGHFPLTATFKISSVFAPSAAYRLLPLVDTLEQYDSLQVNHRRAYSQFRWVWPFALRPALQCPLHLHLDRQKAELWGRPHFGRFSATTRNRHNSLPCPGWFFSASWSRRLNQSCRTAWPWTSKASKSSLKTEWGTRLPEFFNSPRTYRFFISEEAWKFTPLVRSMGRRAHIMAINLYTFQETSMRTSPLFELWFQYRTL